MYAARKKEGTPDKTGEADRAGTAYFFRLSPRKGKKTVEFFGKAVYNIKSRSFFGGRRKARG